MSDQSQYIAPANFHLNGEQAEGLLRALEHARNLHERVPQALSTDEYLAVKARILSALVGAPIQVRLPVRYSPET